MNSSNSSNPPLPRVYLQWPPPPQWGKLRKIWFAITYTLGYGLLSPVYWLLACRQSTPGLYLHRAAAQLGLRLLLQRRMPSYGWAHQLIFRPIDATRYFEFDFAWRALAETNIQHYLDVSSPFLFPILLLSHHTQLKGVLLNPNVQDLMATTRILRALELDGRTQTDQHLIEDAPLAFESFDAITSISVIEHIPNAKSAIQKMWDLLRSGGKLVISLPCAAQASAQYIRHNPYGVVQPEQDGSVFFQHIYDDTLLQRDVLDVTGQPIRRVLYGERSVNFLRLNLQYRTDTFHYNYAREPYLMGQAFRPFDQLVDLPGEGVLMMEFLKP